MAVDVVILAAGLSRRMGTCKALLPWRQGTLLDVACEAYSQLGGQRVVVAGQSFDELASIASSHGYEIVFNDKASLGQGISLARGIQALGTSSRAVLCAVVDQPLMTKEVVAQLVEAYELMSECTKSILCPLYGRDRQRGNPVIFGPDWKQALQRITADHGGREILQGIGKPYIRFVAIEEPVGVDVDTPFEYEQLYNMWGKL